MREIIYRGKSVKTGKWVFGHYQRFVCHGVMKHYIIPSSAIVCDDVKLLDALIEVDEKTVGEFSSIKDKSGEMIFEGDIISSKDSEHNDILHKIVFEDACFRIKSIQTVIERFADCGRLKQEWVNEFEKEVVGNIHDNPELIKKVRK